MILLKIKIGGEKVRVLRKIWMLATIFFCMTAISALAADYGMVTASVLNFRSGPGTNHNVIGQLRQGEVVKIIGNGGNNWVQIVHNGTEGYVSLAYLNVRTEEETDRGEASREGKTGYVTANALNLRAQPSTDSAVLDLIRNGQVLVVLQDMGNGWSHIRVNEKTGYVSNEYISLGEPPAASSKGEQIIAYAKQFLGTPYRYGGMSPAGFDCSGFTKYVFSHFGIHLGRTTYDQVKNGTYVDKANLQIGDLVLFCQSGSVDHVGIYCGGGNFIHSTRPGSDVKIDTLNSGYYSRYYHSGRRVI